MPKYKVTVSWPQLDRERFIRDYNSAATQAIIKAARKFLLAAVPRIPVFTGFARGSLGTLEDVVGRVQGNRISSKLKGVTKEVKRKRNYYYYPPGASRVVRTNISGRQFSTPPDQIISSGRLTKATPNQGRLLFNFKVDITYFDLLDQQWGAFQAGREAFDTELKLQLDKLKPDPGKYLIRRELK
jgi:hypothetical protein